MWLDCALLGFLDSLHYKIQVVDAVSSVALEICHVPDTCPEVHWETTDFESPTVQMQIAEAVFTDANKLYGGCVGLMLNVDLRKELTIGLQLLMRSPGGFVGRTA